MMMTTTTLGQEGEEKENPSAVVVGGHRSPTKQGEGRGPVWAKNIPAEKLAGYRSFVEAKRKKKEEEMESFRCTQAKLVIGGEVEWTINNFTWVVGDDRVHLTCRQDSSTSRDEEGDGGLWVTFLRMETSQKLRSLWVQSYCRQNRTISIKEEERQPTDMRVLHIRVDDMTEEEVRRIFYRLTSPAPAPHTTPVATP